MNDEKRRRARELMKLYYGGIVETESKIIPPDLETVSISGTVLNFNTDIVRPLNSLILHIEPRQSGSGDPSPTNVKPISGYDAVNVVRCGKNLLDPSLYSYSKIYVINGITWTHNDDGTITANGTATADSTAGFFITGHYDGNYRFTSGLDVPTSTADCYMWNSTLGRRCKKWDGTTSSGSPYVGNEPEEVQLNKSDRIVFSLRVKSGKTVDNLVFKPMLLMPTDTDATYEPYQGTTYPISLASAGTVYGGTLDVKSGKLTVDRACIDMGEQSIVSSSGGWTFNTSGLYKKQAGKTGIIAECYSSWSGTVANMPEYYITGGATDSALYFKDTRFTTAAEMKEWLSGHMVSYPLATHLTYQLTPTEVTTLLGYNAIWMDANGTIDAEYWRIKQ